MDKVNLLIGIVRIIHKLISQEDKSLPNFLEGVDRTDTLILVLLLAEIWQNLFFLAFCMEKRFSAIYILYALDHQAVTAL